MARPSFQPNEQQRKFVKSLAGMAVRAPPPLTVRLAADRLTGLKLRWLEGPLTIATPPFDHTGVCRTNRLRRRILKLL